MGDPKRLLCPGGFHRVLLSFHNTSVRQESWLNKPGPISKSSFPGGLGGKESACNAGDPGSIPDFWVGKIPWRRKWQPTPVLLPGESHGWRSLVGYSLWGHKESDTTERLHFTSEISSRKSEIPKEHFMQRWAQ